MDKKIVAIDSQKLTMIQTCEYKYNLTFNRDLTPAVKPEPLENGNLAHQMLEVYYSMHMYIDRWRSWCPKSYILKVCNKVAEHHATKLQLNAEEIDNTILSFRQYLDYYWGERAVTLAVEQVASKVMYEDDNLIILYDAKIDWVVQYGNTIMPVDHKTSKQRRKTVSLNNQFIGYCWILDVNNIMINKFGLQKTVTPKDKFERPILSYSPGVIDEWVKNSVMWVKRLISNTESNQWAQNLTSCDKFNKDCQFLAACEESPESRDRTISQLYDIAPNKWDVGARL